MNQARQFDISIDHYGERESIVFEGRVWTNRQLRDRSACLANALRQLDLTTDARVAVILSNCPEILITALATWRAGLIFVPIHPGLGSYEILSRLRLAEASLVVSTASILPDGSALQKEVPTLRHIIHVDSSPDSNTSSLDFNTVTDCPDPVFDPVARSSSQVATLIYTSGTAGKAQAIPLNHPKRSPAFRNAGYSVELIAAPLTHIYALAGLYRGICGGRKVVLLREFDTNEALQAIADHRVQLFSATPSMLAMILHTSGSSQCDTSSVLVWMSAAAPCSTKLIRDFESKFCGKVLQGYGMTEYPEIAVQRHRESRRIGSVGKAVPGHEIAIWHENGKRLRAHETGEICVRKCNVASPMLRRLASAIASIWAANPTRDDWFRTGDLGYLDDDAHLFIVGRNKDLIIVSGLNVLPGEVQRVIERHPDVRECAVFGLPDPMIGEEIVAHVVAEARDLDCVPEISRHASRFLAKYKVPQHIELVEHIPRTLNGKVDTKVLVENEQARRKRKIETGLVEKLSATSPSRRIPLIEAVILEQVAVQASFERPVEPGKSLFEQGFDSIDAARLVSWLRNAFQIELPIAVIFQHRSISDLARFIDACSEGRETPADPVVDLESEGRLDPEIQPVGRPRQHGGQRKSVLLTGATGFLGAFILRELLTQTRARVYCLVRCDSTEEGLKRIQSNLESYSLWAQDYSTRIRVLRGDLAEPSLGLSNSELSELAENLDWIFHNGAWVNHLRSYDTLKPVNVLGCQEIIRLACSGVSTRMVYISTLPRPQNSDSAPGYLKSKWVAERMVAGAASRGLRASIYNVGFIISGATRSGAANIHDRTCRLLKTCIQIGAVPNSLRIAWVPVDYVAEVIVSSSLKTDSPGSSFCFGTPQYVEANRVRAWMNAFGYAIHMIPDEEWQERLATEARKTHDDNLVAFQALHETGYGNSAIDHRTVETRGTPVPPGKNWPRISIAEQTQVKQPAVSKDQFLRFLSFLVECDFVCAPPNRTKN